MSPKLALILCVALVTVLLRIERRRNPAASGALWVPTFWLLICGSRPIGKWFESATLSSAGSDEAGSPPDRLALIILIIIALLIINKRKIQWSQILKDNFWLTLLFLYLGMSILWSDFPFVSFKRWIRLSGALLIAMVVLSERLPLNALESVFRRCAYVLVPFSLLLIKYFPDYGDAYDSWSGARMWVGVASQKNGLGVICALSAFLIIWAFNREWRTGSLLKTKYQVFADGLVLAIAVFLLKGYEGAYAATAAGILIFGIASLLLLYRMKNNVRPVANLFVLMVVLVLFSLPFIDSLVPSVTSVFHRDSSFTGRTDIWRAVLAVASRNPLLGVGYGAYWGLQDEMIHSTLGVRESHSGYLDVYLECGMVGIILFLMFLLAYYRKVLRELNYEYNWGLFGICLLIMTLIHNFTESNFLRTSSYFWNSTVFVTVVFSAPYLHKKSEADCAYNKYSHANLRGRSER